MLIDQINADLKSAMIARDELKKTTLQGIKSNIKYAEIDGNEMNEEAVVKVLQKEAKKRKESIELYKRGGNQESADKEQAELEIINAYLPEQASDEVVAKAVETAVSVVGATGMQDMGKVMAHVKEALGEVDGSLVAKLVKEKLQ